MKYFVGIHIYLFLGFFIVNAVYAGAETEEFDFIVVGAGAAGCVVAARLSDDGKHSVLLLEAGGVPPLELDVPALAPEFLFGDHPFVKRYGSVKQENAGLANDGVVGYVVGRALGGTTAINAMIWNRGSPHDYDGWASIVGDESWSYKKMLKYHKKVENYVGDFPSDQHGVEGPVTVSKPPFAPGLEIWKEAGVSMGYGYADPNGPQKIGFAPLEFNRKSGKRMSSYTAYIKPHITTRSNLKVITGAWATKIEFEDNQAVGVRFTTESAEIEQHFVKARKEIIVSAGVMESPALLMRSGVGPKDVLDEAGIPAVKYLPVGKNLQDHLVVQLSFVINDKSQVVSSEDLTPANYQKFKETGEGPYSSYAGVTAQAFFQSSITSKKGWADIHLVTFSSVGLTGLFPESGETKLNPGQAITNVIVYLARPKSTGRVTLNTTNIEGDPIIDYKFLTHADDIKVYVEGLKKTLQIYEETEPFQKLETVGTQVSKDPLPACKQFSFRSDEYWSCVVKQLTLSGVHGMGTCSMGKGEKDPNAVVDSKLRVIGVQGLRVVDGSVAPKITNSNVQAAIFAIGEKASDMILKKWKKETKPHSKSEL